MQTYQKHIISDTICFSAVCISLAAAWYIFWVVPRQDFMYSIMDCMNTAEASSQAAYETCAEQIRSERR